MHKIYVAFKEDDIPHHRNEIINELENRLRGKIEVSSPKSIFEETQLGSTDIEVHINSELQAMEALIVIIGEGWNTLYEQSAIEAINVAKSRRIKIIPVLIEGTKGTKPPLPPELSSYKPFIVDYPDITNDVELLSQQIKGMIRPISPEIPQPPQTQQSLMSVRSTYMLAGLGTLVIGVLLVIMARGQTNELFWFIGIFAIIIGILALIRGAIGS